MPDRRSASPPPSTSWLRRLLPAAPLLEFVQEQNPFRDHLATEPIVRKRGKVKVPDGPGLGIEFDRKVIEKYQVG